MLVGAGVAAQESYGPPALPPDPDVQETPAAIPPPLDRAASLAATTHPVVAAAEAESRALEYDYRGARWYRFPNLSAEVLGTTGGSDLVSEDGVAFNVALEQPVWTGGRIGSRIERARAARDAGLDRVLEARQRMVLDVTQAFYALVAAELQAEVLTASLSEHQRLVESIERRVTREVSPQADLTLGRSRTAQVELDVAATREAIESAQLELAALTGGAAIEPALPSPASLAQLPPEEVALAEALQCSPVLAALTDLIDVAEAEKEAAKGNLFPQVLLQLSQNEITGARAAIVLRAQTGNGLSSLAAVDSADARVQRAMAEFGEAERRLRSQLRRDYSVIRSASKRVEASLAAAEAAVAIIESYQRQFVAGRRSWLDVMNALREAASARASIGEAQVAEANSAARVLALTCRWRPSAGEEAS